MELCIWNAPEWFEHLHCLQFMKEYRMLQTLFVNTLELSDATLDGFLEYLKDIRVERLYDTNERETEFALLYDKLDELTEEGKIIEETEIVRYVLCTQD